jgi:hypothetical protein
MEKQLLAIGFEHYSNYIKLPESVLVEFNQPKKSLKTNDFYSYTNSKNKQIYLREHLTPPEVKINPPYYFSIESSLGKITYGGVLDFTADEGICMVPYAELNSLDIFPSDFVTIRYIANVPKGDFVQLEPLQKEIFNIPELDKYLEKAISNYCLLYPEQIISCVYENNQYNIKVKLIKSVCEFDDKPEIIDIVNTDLKIDIFNKFLEEELKEKKQIEKAIEDAKKLEAENAIKNQQAQTQPTEYFTGTGFKLGGNIETTDPALIRAIRLQKLLEFQKPLTQTGISKPIEIVKQLESNTTNTNNTTKSKKFKKSKDIEV